MKNGTLIIIVLFLALGGGAIWYFTRKKDNKADLESLIKTTQSNQLRSQSELLNSILNQSQMQSVNVASQQNVKTGVSTPVQSANTGNKLSNTITGASKAIDSIGNILSIFKKR